jgi:hypothetical protein
MYNRDQQMFGLSMLANLVTGETGTVEQLQSMLAIRIAENLEKYKGQFGPWKLVKSALYQAPDSVVADNVLYLAQNQDDPKDFVLAIAATNAVSIWDWILEDGAVRETVDWSAASDGYIADGTATPKISYGSYMALKILLRLYAAIELPKRAERLQYKVLIKVALARQLDNVAQSTLSEPRLLLWRRKAGVQRVRATHGDQAAALRRSLRGVRITIHEVHGLG